jgi:hypothetical protein
MFSYFPYHFEIGMALQKKDISIFKNLFTASK